MSATRLIALLVVVIVAVGIGLTVLDGEGGSATSTARDERPRSTAVRAATEFLVGLDVETLLDDVARRRHVSRWASHETEAELQRLYDIEARLVAMQPDSFSRVTPLGYRVEGLSADSADVTVWASSLAIVSELFPVIVGWRAAEVGLVLEDGEWRVAKVSDAEAPTPDSPAPRFRAESKQFEEYRLAP